MQRLSYNLRHRRGVPQGMGRPTLTGVTMRNSIRMAADTVVGLFGSKLIVEFVWRSLTTLSLRKLLRNAGAGQ